LTLSNLATWNKEVLFTLWLNADAFLKQDTLTAVATARAFYSTTERNATNLLCRDYGDKDLFAASQSQQQASMYRAARSAY
jgi:hypothetical protein